MMYPHLTEVLRTAGRTEGLDVTLSTNATLMNAYVAGLLATYRIRVHVSIDGPEAFHDAFRGETGAFAKTERGLAELRQAGVPFTVVTTVSQGNLDHFDEVARWAISTGAERLLVQPLLRLGRGDEIADQTLTSPQLLRLIMATSDLANAGERAIKTSIIGGSKRFFLAHPCAAYVCNGGGCHRGVSKEIKKIVVRENGIILPEATNLHEDYAIGRAGDAPLSDLVEAYFASGYADFDRLCRAAYHECVPDWPDPILPWDQILADRSQRPVEQEAQAPAAAGSGTIMADFQ